MSSLMVWFLLYFSLNSVFTTNENAAVSHQINLIIYTLPLLPACGGNKILLMVLYNLTPFSWTQGDGCLQEKPENQIVTSQASFGIYLSAL